MRSRSEETLLTGILWHDLRNMESKPWDNIRHACDQGDGVVYHWTKHDGKNFGEQDIKDLKINIKLKTKYYKTNAGKNWGVQIEGTPIDEFEGTKIAFYYYLGVDGQLGAISNDFEDDAILLSGNLGNDNEFRIDVKNTGVEINQLRFDIPPSNIWQIKDILKNKLIANAQTRIGINEGQHLSAESLFRLDPSEFNEGNVVIFQIIADSPFKFELFFSSTDETPPNEEAAESIFNHYTMEFDKRFENSFSLQRKGFDQDKQQFGQMLLSSMLGGLGFFHGKSIVDYSLLGYDEDDFSDPDDDDEYFGGESNPAPPPNPQEYGPFTLFTGVPSRPFFPRGFLCKDIVNSWLSLMDENGWIAREQILGAEARSKVPSEFQTQYPNYANPPIMAGILLQLIELSDIPHINSLDNVDGAEKSISYRDIQMIYKKFQKHYSWFMETQFGNHDPKIKMGFRWRGRKDSHILTSGLDDYPRSAISDSSDLHVDLLTWMSYFADVLQKTAVYLDIEEDFIKYKEDHSRMIETLNEFHWDPEFKIYTDLSFQSSGISHVVHKGYISILPLLLGQMDKDSSRVSDLLDLIYDPKHLWSDFGICSLSKSDSLFGTEENYWRGPIWIPMNFLLLQSLHRNYLNDGPNQQKASLVYTKLRKNLIKNVFKVHKETGYVWEQYDCNSGKGQRSHPFTGWTSLILSIMAEKY